MIRKNPVVRFISSTANPEEVIAKAARVCYTNMSLDELIDKKFTSEELKKFLQQLNDTGHMSPFEHAQFTFGITHASRAWSHQQVRHRHQSISQRSQRYCDEGEYDICIPPVLGEAQHTDLYSEFMDIQDKIKGWYQKANVSGIGKENSRIILSNATATTMVVSMNARELIEVFFAERMCNRAQAEIRSVATQMADYLHKKHPMIFPLSFMGKCAKTGLCHESRKYGCGAYPNLSDASILVDIMKKADYWNKQGKELSDVLEDDSDEMITKLIQDNTLVTDEKDIEVFKSFLKSGIYKKLFK